MPERQKNDRKSLKKSFSIRLVFGSNDFQICLVCSFAVSFELKIFWWTRFVEKSESLIRTQQRPARHLNEKKVGQWDDLMALEVYPLSLKCLRAIYVERRMAFSTLCWFSWLAYHRWALSVLGYRACSISLAPVIKLIECPFAIKVVFWVPLLLKAHARSPRKHISHLSICRFLFVVFISRAKRLHQLNV